MRSQQQTTRVRTGVREDPTVRSRAMVCQTAFAWSDRGLCWFLNMAGASSQDGHGPDILCPSLLERFTILLTSAGKQNAITESHWYVTCTCCYCCVALHCCCMCVCTAMLYRTSLCYNCVSAWLLERTSRSTKTRAEHVVCNLGIHNTLDEATT